MKITIQDFHTYMVLVSQGVIEKIEIENTTDSSILLPNLDDNDNLYLYDISERVKIYPGINTINKIKEAIDSFL